MPIPATASPMTTLDQARSLLVQAQGVAADASNAPQDSSHEALSGGAFDATVAAELLPFATPRSEFQDLGVAASHAKSGAQLLEQAANAFIQEVPADVAYGNVQRLAGEAFAAFEQAFEVIDND